MRICTPCYITHKWQPGLGSVKILNYSTKPKVRKKQKISNEINSIKKKSSRQLYICGLAKGGKCSDVVFWHFRKVYEINLKKYWKRKKLLYQIFKCKVRHQNINTLIHMYQEAKRHASEDDNDEGNDNVRVWLGQSMGQGRTQGGNPPNGFFSAIFGNLTWKT